MKLPWLLMLSGAVWASSTWAGEIFYARSNGDWEARDQPGRYGALNILDNERSTVWCSAGNGQNAEIEILFSERTSIERMDIAVGNQSTPDDFKSFSRVREMTLSEGDMVHTVQLEDKQGLQTLRFDPTLSTERLVLKLAAGYRGTGERHTCITDILFYKGNKVLFADELARRMRKQTQVLPFLDTWVSGPEGARERELVFGVSESYRFLFVPNDIDRRPFRKIGLWRKRGENLELNVDGAWVKAKVNRDETGRVTKLEIEQDPLAGVFERRKAKHQEW